MAARRDTTKKTRKSAFLTGKPRTLGGGSRVWRASVTRPSANYRSYRVSFKEPNEDGRWAWTSRNATTEAEARKLFDQVEHALDAHRAAPARARVQAERTIDALGKLYLAESRAEHKEDRTIEQRESRLNAHVLPAIGELQVSLWRVEHSREVMEHAYPTVTSSRGREDLRGQLSAMARLAQREGWLDRSVDPLDGLKLPKVAKQSGADESYIDPELRPETRQVDAMARAADILCVPDSPDPLLARLPLFGTKVRVAGYGGLRLGEQNGLRAIDCFFDKGYVSVNGAWVTPRRQDGRGYRKDVKNGVVHEVPLPQSLMHDELLPRVRELFGLPRTASLQQVLNAQTAERQRRARLARQSGDAKLFWFNVPVDPHAEQWLFVDTKTGLPARNETHNERWHRIRRWVDEHDPENAWPIAIVYRNLRHHAATKWFHETLGEQWEVVAQYLGDELQTVLKHYVRTGEDALKNTVNKLEKY